jgi:hypothetical protein
VKIDSTWDPDERALFAEGNAKWNGAPNCSGVHFVGFEAKTFTTNEYNEDAPSDTIYWLKTDPNNQGFDGGVFMAFNLLGRVKSARIKIKPNAVNIVNGSYFVYLGTHEVGHTFNLKDCLCSNQCTCSPGNSIMSGWSTEAFNTGGPGLLPVHSGDSRRL